MAPWKRLPRWPPLDVTDLSLLPFQRLLRHLLLLPGSPAVRVGGLQHVCADVCHLGQFLPDAAGDGAALQRSCDGFTELVMAALKVGALVRQVLMLLSLGQARNVRVKKKKHGLRRS